MFTRVWLLLISFHDNKLFSFTELGSIIVVIVTNLMFILLWVHERFKVILFTSKVTASQDAHGRLVLQVYLGLNTLEFSGIHVGKIFVSRL